MGDLKIGLKECKTLLGKKDDAGALKVAMDLINNGFSDYMLFCFAGLANSNLDDAHEAACMFEKAIKEDCKQLIAWNGLLKIYNEDKLPMSLRGISVCDSVIAHKDSDDTKKDVAVALRRRMFLSLSLYDDLKKDLGESEELMVLIVDKISTKLILSTSEKELLDIAFAKVGRSMLERPITHKKYCVFLFTSAASWEDEVISYCTKNADYHSDTWFRLRLLDVVCERYFVSQTIELSLWNLIDVFVNVPHEQQQIYGEEAIVASLVKLLRDNDVTAALELIEPLTDRELSKYPTWLLASRLLTETEQWERIIKIFDTSKPTKSVTIQQTVDWLRLRAICGSDVDIPQVFAERMNMLPANTEFIIEKVFLDRLLQDSHVSWLNCLDEYYSLVYRLATAVLSEDKSDIQGTTVIADKVAGDSCASWRILVLAAEARLGFGADCTSLLVKAARLNPRSSRAFFLLGSALRTKNPTKAKSCLERALKIRPTTMDYIEVMEDVLLYNKADPAERLINLKRIPDSNRSPRHRRIMADLYTITGDLDSAIGELQHFLREVPRDYLAWVRLADAYAKRGQLQGAINAYEQSMSIDPKSDHIVSLVQVLMRLSKDEEAIVQCEAWRQETGTNKFTADVIDLLEAQIHLRMLGSSLNEERKYHLINVISMISKVIERKPRLSLAYKVAGDALVYASGYRDCDLALLMIPSSWNVGSRLDAARQATFFYAAALELNKTNALAWRDLGVALLIRVRFENDVQLSRKAVDCLKKAVSLCRDAPSRSNLWTMLSEAKRVSGASAAQQQHCLVRALQVNKANDEAWLRLAILYFVNGELSLAHQSFEAALKYNPHSAEAWCGYAAKAEVDGDTHTAMDMFRHSLSVKPLAMAISKYAAYQCVKLKDQRVPYDASTVMIEFDKVLDMYSRCDADEQQLSLMAILAELFGHYQEAEAVLARNSTQHSDINLQRIKLRHGDTSVVCPDSWLAGLASLAKQSTLDLLELLQNRNSTYCNVFDAIKNDDHIALQSLCKNGGKAISIPLVVSAVINFNMSLSTAIVSVLHDVLPRHELIDVFPTQMPEGIDVELKYLEQDGEEPFRFRHHIAKNLVDELKARREALAMHQDVS